MSKAAQKVGVILPAAGAGNRFGGFKQFQKFDNHTLMEYALQPFLEISEVHEIVVVVPQQHLEEALEHVSSFSSTKRLAVVTGGARRQDSVRMGLNALSQDCSIVCVHDAARPFVTMGMITETIAACQDYDGAITAIPASDTLKKASTEENVIEKTIPRETIWQAQTPQTFRRAALEKALAAAEQDGITGTDEAFLLEQLNYKITIIPGSARNIKITTPDDWTIAEALLKGVNND